MGMPKTSKTYPAPEKWEDVVRIKQEMQVDLLTRAQVGAKSSIFAAKRLGMHNSNYLSTCRRLGVPVDHLLTRSKPSWNVTPDQARYQGWKSFENGVLAEACPYSEDALRAAWLQGWQGAEQKHKHESQTENKP